MEFNVIQRFSELSDYGYLGETDAGSILTRRDPRSLTYRIKTKKPGKIKVATSIQLLPDGKPVKINTVGLNIDSSITKGFIRLYYQRDYKWKDVPTNSVQEIKSDSVLFNFKTVEATHIKI